MSIQNTPVLDLPLFYEWNSMEANISTDVLLDTAFDVHSSTSDIWAANKNVNRIYELCDEIFNMNQGGRSL